MQMRLVFSALSFLVNYIEQVASIYTFGVCKLPRLIDEDFRSKCLPFSQKSASFICDMWIGLSLTDVENFRDIINGRFSTCQCERNDPYGETVCFNETISPSRPVAATNATRLDAAKGAATRAGGLDANTPDLTLSIVYISLSDSITAEVSNRNPSAFKNVKNNCDPNNKLSPSSVIYDYTLSLEQYKTEFLEFHRRILKNRWKTKTCSTDIIIFAFDDGGEKQGQVTNEDNLTNAIEELKRTVQVEASAKAKKAYGEQLNQIVTKINLDTDPNLKNPADKIRKLLKDLTALEASKSVGQEHGVPRWAVITFISCICISIMAVVVGNFVNDDSARKRKSSPMAGKSKSKSPWKAGFSGGMWAV